MEAALILVAGKWRKAATTSTFTAYNPADGTPWGDTFPVSAWEDCDAALNAAVSTAKELRSLPGEALATFLDLYAEKIEERATELVEIANVETGLPIHPRLKDVELPRMARQLRQGAAAARERSWTHVVIDSKANIRSHYAPIGPVVVFGPNNFPFAFNGVSGGDFTAAVAAGNPVIAKAHPLHPGTSRLLAECALAALGEAGLPLATVQMLYNISNENGLRLVSDPRVGAVSFTGSRQAGLNLRAAADGAGKPIYLEMSSLNPVVILPSVLRERAEQLAVELADSCLAASGQFCTSPKLILVIAGDDAEKLAACYSDIAEQRAPAPLLSATGLKALNASVEALVDTGAAVVIGAKPTSGGGYRYENTLLRTTAEEFLAKPGQMQSEAFGNSTMLVTARDAAQLQQLIEVLEGSLTGSIYSSTTGEDDEMYFALAGALRPKVGRLLNDKMPTGVALSPAMNHGGPYPSTAHPGFTAVGIPASIIRFAALHCYDNVRPARLPAELRDKSPNSTMWRLIDGSWIKG